MQNLGRRVDELNLFKPGSRPGFPAAGPVLKAHNHLLPPSFSRLRLALWLPGCFPPIFADREAEALKCRVTSAARGRTEARPLLPASWRPSLDSSAMAQSQAELWTQISALPLAGLGSSGQTLDPQLQLASP